MSERQDRPWRTDEVTPWGGSTESLCVACDGTGWHLGDEQTSEACVVCGGDGEAGYQ